MECCLPADYTVTHLEALTFLLHYCLLDTSQQIGFSFNQPLSGTIQTGIPGANPGQIFNNLIHVFMPSPLSPVSCTFTRGISSVEFGLLASALCFFCRILSH